MYGAQTDQNNSIDALFDPVIIYGEAVTYHDHDSIPVAVYTLSQGFEYDPVPISSRNNHQG